MKCIIKDNKCFVEASYSTTLVKAMKDLGGRWEKPYWVISESNKYMLFDILEDLYGHNGYNSYEMCTVIVDVSENSNNDKIEIGCNVFGLRRNRDNFVSLSNNCCIVSGELPKSGGSVKSPKIEADNGTRMKIEKFPVKLISKIKGEYEIVEGDFIPNKYTYLSTEDLIKELENRGYDIFKRNDVIEGLLDA